ncbi:MAG: phosphate acyltransferase PlsX, partial [Thermoplasmata archaeon]|nr:phosphate acyltransferase PlsX [Thermoplasmata archaeon]
MIIAVDAMGGDHAPEIVVKGAIKAGEQYNRDVEITLVGRRDAIVHELAKYNSTGRRFTIVNAPQVVGMDESPVAAVRSKPHSSISVMIDMLRNGKVDAAFSAGNTGAMVAAAKLRLGSLQGVDRPAIATIIPHLKGLSVLLDAGATTNCKAINLVQFAVMGFIYARDVLNIPNPRIGLLNIGEEAYKGNELTREVFPILKRKRLNFLGNIEGRDVFNGKADVIICDGFVGNVILKVSESIAFALHQIFEEEIVKRPFAKLGSVLIKPALKALMRRADYAQY